jgi:ribosomal-protein-alanine N-acetyltransferase
MRQPIDEGAGRPGTLRFRRMRQEDLTRVVEIEKDGFRHPWSRELLERELAHTWSTVLLAVDEGDGGERAAGASPGRILGFVVFWLVHDELHILNIASAVEARRRGIGRALMLEASAAARARGAALSTLEVRRSNAPAIALYLSLDYRQVGIRPNYYADEGEDAIVMVKEL